MYEILDDAGINIIRVGLKSSDIIADGNSISGKTFHPAFRQLVDGEIARDRITPILDRKLAELPHHENPLMTDIYSSTILSSLLLRSMLNLDSGQAFSASSRSIRRMPLPLKGYVLPSFVKV